MVLNLIFKALHQTIFYYRVLNNNLKYFKIDFYYVRLDWN